MVLTTERQQFEQWWEIAMHNGYPPRFGWEHWRDGGGYRDDGEFQGLWQAWQASRGLLANRASPPVAWRHDDGPFAGIAITRAKSVADSWIAKGWAVTPLYTAPPAPAVPDDYQHLKNVQEMYHSQEERLFALAQRIKGVSFDKYSHTTAQAIDVLEREIFGDDGGACRAAMLGGDK